MYASDNAAEPTASRAIPPSKSTSAQFCNNPSTRSNFSYKAAPIN